MYHSAHVTLLEDVPRNGPAESHHINPSQMENLKQSHKPSGIPTDVILPDLESQWKYLPPSGSRPRQPEQISHLLNGAIDNMKAVTPPKGESLLSSKAPSSKAFQKRSSTQRPAVTDSHNIPGVHSPAGLKQDSDSLFL